MNDLVEGVQPTPAGEPIPAPTPDETVNQDQSEPAPERTFTQAELDEIVNKRLAREHRKLEKLEREAEIARAVQQDREQRSQPQASNDPPQRENFDSYEDYLEARSDWKVEQKLSEREAQIQEERVAIEAQARLAEQTRTWEERAEKAAEKYADFADVVTNNDDLPISPVMAQAIRGNEAGIDVAYHLGKNPSEAARIAKLDPVSQVFELGRLSASLPAAKPVSKATPPLETVSGSRSQTRGSIDEPGISTEEYIRRRNAQLKQAG